MMITPELTGPGKLGSLFLDLLGQLSGKERVIDDQLSKTRMLYRIKPCGSHDQNNGAIAALQVGLDGQHCSQIKLNQQHHSSDKLSKEQDSLAKQTPGSCSG